MRILCATAMVACLFGAGPAQAQQVPSTAALDSRGITFYAPLDGDAAAVHARGNPDPIYLDSVTWVEGKFGRAALARPSRERSLGKVRGRATGLNYDALGHLYGERGTLAYWCQPKYDADDPAIRSGSNSTGPALVNVSAVENTYARIFIRTNIKGGAFYFWVVDAVGAWHGCSYGHAIKTWKSGQWHHLVLTWDAAQGMRFYDNGELKYSTWGRDPFPPATPFRVGVGCNGPTARPESTRAADAVYDELVMMDRAVSGAEVGALMEGRLLDLQLSPSVQYTAEQLVERRAALMIEPDPNRPVYTPRDGVVRATLRRLAFAEVHVRFILAALLTDGRWKPAVRFAQGGFRMPRDITVRVASDTPANYMVVAGRPGQGEAFSIRSGELTLPTTAAGVSRASLAAATSRLVLQVPGDSAIGEIQLFHQSPEVGDDLPRHTYRMTCRGQARILGSQAGRLLRRLSPADRQLLVPSDATEGAFEPLFVAPTRHLYLATPPFAHDAAVRSVLLRMPTAPAGREDVLRITIPHAWEADTFYLSADLGVVWDDGQSTIEVLLEGPGMIFPKDTRLLVEVATSQGFRVTAPPELALDTEPPVLEAKAFAQDYLRAINEEFTSRMSHNFKYYMRGIDRDNPLTRALGRILRFDPNNGRALELQHWARIKPWPEFAPTPEGPEEFPEVVKYARMAAREARNVIHWWIDERQDQSGYVVGRADQWNDDTKLFNEYAFLWLLSGDAKLAGAVKTYLAAHWGAGRMKNGWSKPFTDIVHSAEEASYLEPTMALYAYGDPLHLEQLMQTASNIATWTATDELGHRHFKSNFFTADKMKTEGHFGRDVGLNATAMTASMYLAWYSRHPRATREFLEWVGAWVADSMRETEEKPAGCIPSWIDSRTGALGADRGVYPSEITMMMMAAYQLTGDHSHLQPLRSYLRAQHPRWPQYLNMAAADLRRDLGPGGYDKALLRYADQHYQKLAEGYFFQRGLYYQELPGVLGWLLTGEIRHLEMAAFHAWRCNHHGRNIYTVEDPHKDRVYPWGGSVLPWMYCGGNALNRRGSGPYPTVRVSWADTGYDFAALMRDQTRTRLRLTAYNFSAARDVGMTVWNMQPGAYTLTVTPLGGAPAVWQVTLVRGETVRFALPDRSWAEVELELVEPSDWSPLRADLAVSMTEGIRLEGDVAVVTVHNVGSRAAPACKAALLHNGKPVSEVTVPALEAPLDFVPRTVQIRFDLPAETVSGALTVAIDTDDTVAEITERNNTMTIEGAGHVDPKDIRGTVGRVARGVDRSGRDR